MKFKITSHKEVSKYLANNISGVYMIKNNTRNKIYIGSSICLKSRLTTHFRDLKNNIHTNPKLQNSYNKTGLEGFELYILKLTINEELVQTEQYFLDNLLFAQQFINKEDNRFRVLGYNITPTAGSSLGRRLSPKTKEKIKDSILKSERYKKAIKRGKDHWAYGKLALNRGKPQPNFNTRRKIIALLKTDTNQRKVFNTAKEVKENGFIIQTVRGRCNKKFTKTISPEYQGYYWFWYEDFIQIQDLENTINLYKNLDAEKVPGPQISFQCQRRDLETNEIETVTDIDLRKQYNNRLIVNIKKCLKNKWVTGEKRNEYKGYEWF